MPRGRPKSHLPPCKFCNREFKRLEHLKRHERTRACCRQLFLVAIISNLAVNLDTQEKPFQCQCGHSFSRQDLLSRHERLHHAQGRVTRSSGLSDDIDIVEELEHRAPLQIEPPDQLGLSFHPSPLSDEIPSNPSNMAQPASDSYGVTLSQDALQLPDLSWDNDAFSFPDFIPSQFLDTGVSLSDLFQQMPPQNELGTYSSAENGSISAPQLLTPTQSKSSPLHSDLHDSMNLRHPPRFPSLGDNIDISNMDTRSETANCPWAVLPSNYRTIMNKMTTLKPALLNTPFPSKCTLVRYLEGYFRKFHDHFPFLHMASFRPENVGIELLLSMAAVGAFYCFEYREGYRLYGAARSLIESSLGSCRDGLIDQLISHATRSAEAGHGAREFTSSPRLSSHATETPRSSASLSEDNDLQARLERAQALIILIATGTWGDQALLQDSLAMSSQLAYLVRQLGIDKPDDSSNANLDWLAWTAHEQLRRTLLVAYVILNLNSIITNVPPMILTPEVALCLPSCEAEWGANSSVAWQRHRDVSALRERPFVQTLNQLFIGQSICDEWGVSAFSNYLLIHAILQRIYLEIQIPRETSFIQPELFKTFEQALRLWQHSWETTWESTLDPNSPKGPIGFNATALLRLAYIRLNIRTGLCHDFVTSDTSEIKEGLAKFKQISLVRSAPLDRAILQCIHALSIPVRVGIQNVACTQVMHWGIQHSICHLECALLLSLWVQNIAEVVRTSGLVALRGDELKLLTMAKGLVKETHLQETIDYQEETAENLHRLAASTARLWAEITSGTHVFDIVRRIGICLSVISDALESEACPGVY
ncbi:hypothetical protein N7452_002182 [Penicillium brevicompactum]|uniref:C2H2-type domain-containing protein n=1 Tax=Penicillium brevicompactum TaxID=5074 RepID=A0A9W9R3V3_PENBR|nr:hypothetical protein N7452_002182 [Penicillium brevicompactum]